MWSVISKNYVDKHKECFIFFFFSVKVQSNRQRFYILGFTRVFCIIHVTNGLCRLLKPKTGVISFFRGEFVRLFCYM